MIVAVVGSRNYPNLNDVREYVRKIAEKHPDAVIVSGGAKGVDRTAENAAKKEGLDVVSYRPSERTNAASKGEFAIEVFWRGERARKIVETGRLDEPGPRFATFTGAAKRRNSWIVEDADVVVAFTTGSSGTADTIAKAKRDGKKLVVHERGRLAA